MKKKGLSAVVTSVLIVVLVLVVIVVAWQVISRVINSAGSEISSEVEFYGVEFSIVPGSLKVNITDEEDKDDISFILERKAGGGSIDGFLIVLIDELGNKYTINKYNTTAMDEFAKKEIEIFSNEYLLSGTTLVKIEIYAVIIGNDGSINTPNTPSGSGDGGGDEGEGCFLAGTLILTSDGEVAIENLKIGDEVVSYDLISKKMSISEVKKIFVTEREGYYLINDKIKVTGEHPFYVSGEWVEVNDLKIGDELFNSQRVNSIVFIDEIAEVYNLFVSDYNNYFAGGVLVHNKGDAPPAGDCIPNCDGTTCGSDGCEGTCTCSSGTECVDEACYSSCSEIPRGICLPGGTVCINSFSQLDCERGDFCCVTGTECTDSGGVCMLFPCPEDYEFFYEGSAQCLYEFPGTGRFCCISS